MRLSNFKALLAGLVLSLGVTTASAQDYVLATASTGGTYYPVGVALATLSKVKLQPKQKFSLSAISSAGSAENVKLIGTGEAHFAILQGLYGSYAWNGTGPLADEGKQKNLRAVTMLWQNVEQFLIASEYAKTGTVDDLKAVIGKGAGMGRKNSGTIGSNRTLLAGLGINIDDDFRLYYGGYGPTATELQNGSIAAAGIPSGPPTGAITQLMASAGDKVTLLSLTPEHAKKMDGGKNLWTPYTIKAGTYPNQTKDVTTVAQPNFLAVSKDVDEEHVYLLTKTIYENLPFLQAIHPATKAMAVKKAIAGLPVPLHEGAKRYYEEVGVL